MNPELKRTTSVFLGFKLGFFGFYSAETIELFSYRSEHFNENTRYHWDALSTKQQSKIIAETYDHWYRAECDRLSVQRYEVFEIKD